MPIRFIPVSLRVVLGLVVGMVWLVGGSAGRAQGLSNRDREAVVSALTELPGAVRAGARPASVDLRAKLPPVGNQSMNDCAAWAFGYAARSYLEAVDQGWAPDAPDRIFSPTFIYNQVNHGEDKGSNPGEVLQFLQSKGAATLATTPYLPRDYTTAPPALAAREAGVFTIEGSFLLRDGEAIREALAAGDIVVVGVRTNPVFNGGRYELYTTAMHQSARLARKPDQPHGYHAMVICGYSDERQAFLFMNSWGKDWGRGGFVWVSYGVVDVFNNSVATENLMDFACVLVDRRQLVHKKDGRYVAAGADDLGAVVKGEFWGGKNGVPSHVFSASIRGPADLRKRIKQVTWTFEDAGKTTTLVATRADLGFAIQGTTSNRLQAFAGRAEFHNGTVQEYTAALALEEGKLHHPRLGRVDQFIGINPQTKAPEWHVVYYPDLSDQDWKELKSIYWPGTGKAVVPYDHPGGLAPDFEKRTAAYRIKTLTAPEAGQVIFSFKDTPAIGYAVALPGEAFTAPAVEQAVATYIARPVGRDAGRDWYFYEVQARYPRNWARNVRMAVALVGSEDEETQSQMRLNSAYGIQTHTWGGFTYLPLNASVRLEFFDSRAPWDQRNNSATLVVKPGNAAMPAPAPDPDRGMGIAFTDTYVGLVDGEPTWTYRAALHRLHRMLVVQSETWKVDGQEVPTVQPGEAPPAGAKAYFVAGPLEGFIGELVVTRGAKPFTVEVDLAFHPNSIEPDQRPLTLRRELSPDAPANDALALIAVEGARDSLLANVDLSTSLANVRVAGTAAALAEVREVEGFYDTPWGGRDRMSTARDGRVGPAERLSLRLPQLGKGRAVQAVLTFEDDSRMAVGSVPAPDSPFLYSARLQLEARERFLGYAGEAPRWGGQLRVTGDHRLVSAIERVDYAATAIDGAAVAVMPAKASPRSASVETSEPLRLTAKVFFKAASGFAPLELETVMHTSAERSADELRLAIDEVWRAPHKWKPSDTIADMEDPELPRVVHLAGHAWALERVAGVEYTSVELEQGVSRTLAAVGRKEKGVDGFPAFHTFPVGKHEVQAKVRFKDGKTRVLRSAVDQPLEPEPVRPIERRVRFWETNEQGAPTYLVSYRLSSGGERVKVDYMLEGAHTPLWPWGATSYARGAFPWDAVASGEAVLSKLTGYTQAYEGSMELAPLEILFEPEGTLTDGVATLGEAKLEVVPDPAGRAQVCFVRIVAPEKLLGKVSRVEYDVEQSGQMRTLRPLDRFGETGDRFDCRLVGATPTRITARLLGAGDGAGAGEVTATLSWAP